MEPHQMTNVDWQRGTPDAEHVYSFNNDVCPGCTKDANEDCPIIAAAFSAWPAQWVDGKCADHSQNGFTQRCPNTQELPL